MERAENKVLRQHVKDLTDEIHKLRVENQSLLAEVEMYRADALKNGIGGASDSSNNYAGGISAGGEEKNEGYADEFISSGDGSYPTNAAVTLPSLHGPSNPLCCALNHNDTLLATGGADLHISLCTWGSALSPAKDAAKNVVQNAARIRCDAPIICLDINKSSSSENLVAAGCMDGSVQLATYDTASPQISASALTLSDPIKHVKYVQTVAFSPTSSLLASASANGTVRLTKIKNISSLEDVDITTNKPTADVEEVKTLHLSGPIEAMCFLNDGKVLCVYIHW